MLSSLAAKFSCRWILLKPLRLQITVASYVKFLSLEKLENLQQKLFQYQIEPFVSAEADVSK